MDTFKKAALEQGVSVPPEGESWMQHLLTLAEEERSKYISFLRKLQPVKTAEEAPIRQEIATVLASLPANPTQQDYKDAGIELIDIKDLI